MFFSLKAVTRMPFHAYVDRLSERCSPCRLHILIVPFRANAAVTLAVALLLLMLPMHVAANEQIFGYCVFFFVFNFKCTNEDGKNRVKCFFFLGRNDV